MRYLIITALLLLLSCNNKIATSEDGNSDNDITTIIANLDFNGDGNVTETELERSCTQCVEDLEGRATCDCLQILGCTYEVMPGVEGTYQDCISEDGPIVVTSALPTPTPTPSLSSGAL